jgi:cyclopropane fatty-acyl-phospholipid synthase-like methyltransferase
MSRENVEGTEMLDGSLAAQRWDTEYRSGRYRQEAPVPFVAQIITSVKANPVGANRRGLYIGCGNGRNYLPLVDAGLDIYGLDLSQEAITQLVERRPLLAERLVCGDFRNFSATLPFGYVVAIQVFQHGTEADIALYFKKVAELLDPGGLFCLRVNSVSTEIYHAHQIVEQNNFGGITVQYQAGPKQGIPVHFYSWTELDHLTKSAFRLVDPPQEAIMMRSAPQTGFWAQWEAVWEKC